MNCFMDLHMHSVHSMDGEIAPAKLVKMCKDAGIRIMAIADHDNVKGVEEGLKAAGECGITCIPAIELYCVYKGLHFHVLGYGIDYTNPVFNRYGQKLWDQYLAANDRLIELTNQLGFELTKEDLDAVSANGVYIGENFAEVLLNDPRYTEHELLKPYREGGSRSDRPYVNFYWDFYAFGKECYVEIVYPPMEEIIQVILENGGVPVIAHPGQNLKGHLELFDEIVALGMQGVEAFSSYHTEEENEFFLKKGREQNLLVTCGSDFHGWIKPDILVGGSGCTIDQKEIEAQLREYGLL